MFTYADMKQLYAEHGNALSWWPEPDDGPYSANPGDYWNSRDTDPFRGELRVHVPEHYTSA